MGAGFEFPGPAGQGTLQDAVCVLAGPRPPMSRLFVLGHCAGQQVWFPVTQPAPAPSRVYFGAGAPSHWLGSPGRPPPSSPFVAPAQGTARASRPPLIPPARPAVSSPGEPPPGGDTGNGGEGEQQCPAATSGQSHPPCDHKAGLDTSAGKGAAAGGPENGGLGGVRGTRLSAGPPARGAQRPTATPGRGPGGQPCPSGPSASSARTRRSRASRLRYSVCADSSSTSIFCGMT